MAPKEDLLELWLQQRKEKSAPKTAQPQPAARGNGRDGDASGSAPMPDVPADRRPTPTLSGKLADYLAQKERRDIEPEHYDADDRPWTAEDAGTKTALAVSLVLAAHIARFAGTTIDEKKLLAARDSLMRLFGPRDAVKIEVEAYSLMSWFAGAIDPEWRAEADAAPQPEGETSRAAMLQILEDAIRDGHDLMMHYYTSSRSAFSDRRITPIDVTAEKYLVAYCHTRREKRVFRLSRIVRLVPVDADEVPIADGLCYPNAQDTRVPALPKVSLGAAVGAGEGKPKAKSPKKGADTPKAESPTTPPRKARKGTDAGADAKKDAPKKPSGKGGRQMSLFDD